jgi:hypothetical protein
MRTKYARRIRLSILVARYDMAQNTSFANSIKEPNGISENLSEALAVFEGKENIHSKNFYSTTYFRAYENYKKYFQPRGTNADRLKMIAKINDYHSKLIQKEIEEVEKAFKEIEKKK